MCRRGVPPGVGILAALEKEAGRRNRRRARLAYFYLFILSTSLRVYFPILYFFLLLHKSSTPPCAKGNKRTASST